MRAVEMLEIDKLGGTSVDDLEQSCRVVANNRGQGKANLVFVSARSKFTSNCLNSVRVAVNRGVTGNNHGTTWSTSENEDLELEIPDYWVFLGDYEEQTHERIKKYIDDPKEAEPLHVQIKERISEARSDFASMAKTKTLVPAIRDRHCGLLGEGTEAPFSAALLRCSGVNAVHHEAAEIMETDGNFGNANPVISAMRRRFEKSGLISDLIKGTLVVVGGYYGTDRDGRITVMSRGGTDRSATSAGQALIHNFNHIEVVLYKADEKLAGVMSADPNSVTGTHCISHLIHEEARALAAVGGNVLHSKAVHHAVWSGSGKREPFPIYVKSTINPDLPGTLIDNQLRSDDPPIQAITRMRNVIRAGITGWGMDRSGIAAKFFRVFSDRGVDIAAIVQSASKASLDIAYQFERDKGIEKECKIIEEKLAEVLRDEIQARDIDERIIVRPSQLIGIVGRGCLNPHSRRRIIEGMLNFPELQGVNSYEEISGDYDISLIVNLSDERLEALVQSIHDSVFR